MAEVWERLARERRQGIVENGPDKAQHQTKSNQQRQSSQVGKAGSFFMTA